MGENEKTASQETQAAASEEVSASPFKMVAEEDAMETEARTLLEKINRELDDLEERAKQLRYPLG